MARGLTVRTLGRLRTFCQRILHCNNSLQEEGKGVSTAIYVDEATMVLWAKQAMVDAAEPPALNHMAYEVARKWTGMVVNLLRLQTSDKNVLVPPGQPSALRDSLDTLIRDPHRAKRLGEAGLEHVSGEYSVDTWKGKLLSLYSELVPAQADTVPPEPEER